MSRSGGRDLQSYSYPVLGVGKALVGCCYKDQEVISGDRLINMLIGPGGRQQGL